MISEAISKALKDPNKAISLCRRAFKDVRSGYRTDLYDILAVGYAVNEGFRTGKGNWREFCDDEFWAKTKRGRPKTRKNAMHSVLYFILGLARYDRAMKYARGLEYLRKQKVRSEDVAARVKKEKGIEALYRKAKEKEPRHNRKKKASSKKLLHIAVGQRRHDRLAHMKPGDIARLEVVKLISTRMRFKAIGLKKLSKPAARSPTVDQGRLQLDS